MWPNDQNNVIYGPFNSGCVLCRIVLCSKIHLIKDKMLTVPLRVWDFKKDWIDFASENKIMLFRILTWFGESDWDHSIKIKPPQDFFSNGFETRSIVSNAPILAKTEICCLDLEVTWLFPCSNEGQSKLNDCLSMFRQWIKDL